MKVSDLIKCLQGFNPEAEISIADFDGSTWDDFSVEFGHLSDADGGFVTQEEVATSKWLTEEEKKAPPKAVLFIH